jgi:hypothetical protein
MNGGDKAFLAGCILLVLCAAWAWALNRWLP